MVEKVSELMLSFKYQAKVRINIQMFAMQQNYNSYLTKNYCVLMSAKRWEREKNILFQINRKIVPKSDVVNPIQALFEITYGV